MLKEMRLKLNLLMVLHFVELKLVGVMDLVKKMEHMGYTLYNGLSLDAAVE